MNTRRSLLQAMLAAGIAPAFVPARLLRAESAPSNKITLGVIGAGSQGTVDLRAFLNHDDVRVTALCDVNGRHIENAKKFVGDRYGSADVKVYHDFREMNRDKSIDAVLMALPVHWHSIPAADAILNGKHIYHEKPMGMSIEEAKFVREAVRKTGVVFQFGTQQRSNLKFRWAAELALNGRLGKLKEIRVGVPGGKTLAALEEQPVPNYLDWDRWVGPAPMTPFNEAKLKRDNHENISNFSLGMISCWGIHHLDIAQWGNGTDATGPVSVEGTATYPASGACDRMLGWSVRMKYANGAPILFENESSGPNKISHGAHFIGESGTIRVVRGTIWSTPEDILKDPQNKYGTMPVKLPVSIDHSRNFVDAIKNKQRAICDIDTSVRSDALCQLTAIALQTKRKVQWDPQAERFVNDAEADKLMAHRVFRGEWKLPT
jgi:predicted dehydrogenase